MSDTLWDGWAPPSGKDENSAAAADSMILVAGGIRRRVLEYVAEHGPVAEWQVADGLGLPRPTATPRIFELHRAGVIERVPVKGTTPSGRSCWRYVVTPFWLEYIARVEEKA